MFHVFLDSLYSNSPTSFSIAYPRKMRFPCLCFFYKSCERKTIPLILSPESQVTLTILSTLRPLYHNPHSPSQFTKKYHISYRCINLLQLYICQGCQRFETSVFFSEKNNISTTGGSRVGFIQPDTNHP